MDDLISRTWLLAEYDKRHKGPPGGARKLIEEAPSALGTNLAEVGTDAISRQQAIDAADVYMKRLCRYIGTSDDTRAYAFARGLLVGIKTDLGELPSAQPKMGKWIEDKGQQTLMKNFIERGEVWRVCSVCGAGHMIGHRYAIDKAYHDRHHNFCPNCGAKMEVTE